MCTYTIAVDFDDVLFPFNQLFAPWHNERYGTSVTYEAIQTFDMPTMYEVSAEVIFGRVETFYQSAEHLAARPLPGVIEFIKTLSKHKEIGLEVVTARPRPARYVTELWLETWLHRHFDCVHLTNQFTADATLPAATKGQICKEIGAAVLIEDSLHHAMSAAAEGIIVLMPDRPWNRQQRLPEGVTRCPDFSTIYAELAKVIPLT